MIQSYVPQIFVNDNYRSAIGKDFSKENPYSKYLVSTIRAKVSRRESFIQKLVFKNGTEEYRRIDGREDPKYHENRMEWGRNAIEESIEFTKNSEILEVVAFSWYY